MSFGYPPSHRGTDEPQPEICDLCGVMVGASRLKRHRYGELSGMLICDLHPSAPDKPSFDELPSPMVGVGHIERDHGQKEWWHD